MSFTDRQPFIVTEVQMKLRWGGGFWCKLCGHKFVTGDRVRWVYANGTKDQRTGNFFVCNLCDGNDSDVLSRANASFMEAVKLAKQWGIYGPDWERESRQ